MKYRTVFDIIGPVMVGPSSSHTAGAVRIGRIARSIFAKKPDKVEITLYGSFAQTYRGHGTDVALAGGLLDFDTFDCRMPDALVLAAEAGIEITFQESQDLTDHPNTARLKLIKSEECGSTSELEIVGTSIGGGKIEIVELDGFSLSLSGNLPVLFVLHQDQYGAVARVATILAQNRINIGFMQVARKTKGSQALMVIETDQSVNVKICKDIEEEPGIYSVAIL